MLTDDPRHGTRAGYYAHRHDSEPACDPCKRAAAAAEAARQLRLMHGQHGRLDATGTRRRLQALVWMGWNWVALGDHIGSNEVMVKRWAERDTPGSYVFPDTARRVAEVYERLSMTFPPETTRFERNAAARARNRARRQDWQPPLAWDDIDDPAEQPRGTTPARNFDPAVVERILAGEWTLRATRAERMAVIEAFPGSANDLERLTGWNVRRYKREEAA